MAKKSYFLISVSSCHPSLKGWYLASCGVCGLEWLVTSAWCGGDDGLLLGAGGLWGGSGG